MKVKYKRKVYEVWRDSTGCGAEFIGVAHRRSHECTVLFVGYHHDPNEPGITLCGDRVSDLVKVWPIIRLAAKQNPEIQLLVNKALGVKEVNTVASDL